MSEARSRRPNEPRDLVNGTLQDVLAALNIVNWDAVVVGDGSGSGWTQGAGWASVVITRNGRRSPLLLGAYNSGTVNVAELQALLHGLMWLDEEGGGKALCRQKGALVDVHLITDSEITVNQGNGKYKAKGVTRILWGSVRVLEKDGYRLHFHWYGRDGIALNKLCDHASREARLAVEPLSLVRLLDADGITVYDFNPFV